MTTMGSITARPTTGPIEGMTIEGLRLLVQHLETENAAMRPIVLRMAEARMCRDTVTVVSVIGSTCSMVKGAINALRVTPSEEGNSVMVGVTKYADVAPGGPRPPLSHNHVGYAA